MIEILGTYLNLARNVAVLKKSSQRESSPIIIINDFGSLD